VLFSFSLSPTLAPFCHVHYGLNNLGVACASTDIAADPLAYVVLTGVGIPFRKALADINMRCAESALDCAMVNEGLLQQIKLTIPSLKPSTCISALEPRH
jgi:hypothetical protein